MCTTVLKTVSWKFCSTKFSRFNFMGRCWCARGRRTEAESPGEGQSHSAERRGDSGNAGLWELHSAMLANTDFPVAHGVQISIIFRRTWHPLHDQGKRYPQLVSPSAGEPGWRQASMASDSDSLFIPMLGKLLQDLDCHEEWRKLGTLSPKRNASIQSLPSGLRETHKRVGRNSRVRGDGAH